MGGGDGSGGDKTDEGKRRTICDGEGICNPEGRRQRLKGRRQRKARTSRRLVNLVQAIDRLKSELERLRGRARQAEKIYVWTSRSVHVLRPLTFARA